MSYKRVVKRRGKTYGPYVYESYRDENGKVKKRYLGKLEKPQLNVRLGLSLGVLVLILFLSISYTTTFFMESDDIVNEISGARIVITRLIGFVISEDVVNESVSEEEVSEETIDDVNDVPQVVENITEDVPEDIIEVINETELNETESDETELNQTELNQTELNQTELNETELNETELNETVEDSIGEIGEIPSEVNASEPFVQVTSDTNVTQTERVVQYGATLGQPVRWKKVVTVKRGLNSSDNIVVEVGLSVLAGNITVKKVDVETGVESVVEAEIKNEKKVEEVEANVLITGNVISISSGIIWNSLVFYMGDLFVDPIGLLGITGRVIDALLDEEVSVEVEVVEEEEEIVVEYFTDAPYAEEVEITDLSKEITVIGPDEVHYVDVNASTELPVEVSSVDSIEMYWLVNGSRERVEITPMDLDENGLYDSVWWIVPHLSEQVYEIIIITNAVHLDSDRVFVGDVYDLVSERDGTFVEIPAGDYVRVTFEQNLTNEKDITIYGLSSGGSVEVYEKDSDVKLADFGEIGEDVESKIYLTELNGTQDTFDLKVVNASVEFDWIVDPKIGTSGNISFVDPTPGDGDTQATTNVEIYVNITANLSDVVYNWDGTNYTMYNDSLVLMYNFDNVSALGESSLKVVDLAGGDNNGTVEGATVNTTDCKYGNCYMINQGGEHISVGDYDALSPSVITLSAWIRPNIISGGRTIIGKGDIDYPEIIYWLYQFDDELNFIITYGGTLITTPSTNLVVGEWYHVAATFNGTNMSIYVNGVNEVSSGTTDTIVGGSHSLEIGRFLDDTSTWYNFDGNIDEVRIWNRSLSSDEIYQQYVSNLNKEDTDSWNLYVNQSLNATDGLSVGDYTYVAYAADTVGNWNNTGERSITVSSTGPEVTINYPVEGGDYGVTDFPMVFNVSLNENGSVWYSLDGGVSNFSMIGNETDSAFGTLFNVTNSSMPFNTYTLNIYANDTEGNTNFTESVTFTYDNRIYECGVIGIAGSYAFNQSFNVKVVPCINITTNGVTIEGAGYALGNALGAPGPTIGIYSEGTSGLNLQNLSFENDVSIGIKFESVSSSTIYNFTEVGSGIHANPIYLIDSSGITVDGFYSRGLAAWGRGVRILGGSGHTIKNSEFYRGVADVTLGLDTRAGQVDIVNSNGNNIFDNIFLDAGRDSACSPGGKNYSAIYLESSDSNNIYSNNISHAVTNCNETYAFQVIGTSASNNIYDNWINYTNTAYSVINLIGTGANNWNSTGAGTNILGENTMGGNYWANGSETGYSETCTDTSPNDGFCDSPLNISSSRVLMTACVVGSTCGDNVDLVPLIIYSDSVAPALTIVYPVNGSNHTTDVSELNFSVSDSGTLDKCWYSKNGGTTNLSVQACTTNFTHVVSTEGWNNWTVYANDTVGNENSSLVNFFKDSVNPAVTVHSPTAGLSSSSEILFNVTATDAGSVDECWVTIDSGATNTSLVNDVGTDYYDATNSSVPDNSYTAQFYCNDSLGNLNDSLTVAFSVDSTAPALTIVYPENGTNHTTDVSELNFSVSDGGTLDKCWYSKDGGTNNLSVQACTSNFTSVVSTEGWNNWTVFANDIAGNENSSLVEFFKDSVNPGVTINLPTATTYLVGSYAVNITLDEVGYCEYSVNGGAANTTLTTTDDLTFTRSVTGAANAAYTLVAYCNDSYGNNNYTTNVTFTVAVPAAATGGSSGTDEVEVDIEEEESVEIEEVVDEKVCGEWGECISDVQKRDCVSGSGVESVETQECACVPEWVCTSNQECVGSLDIHSMPDVSFGCSWSDMNQDGKIDVGDLAILSANWNRRDCSPSNSWCNLADINRNGEVGLFDQMFLVRHFDTSVRDCDPSVPVSESVGYVINSCEDLHECGDILSKPEEVVECSVGCEEEWVCNWSVPCVGGFITPVCEDSNSCGTFSSMPSKITCEVLDEFEYLNEEQKETSSSPSSSGRSGSVCVPDIACDKWSECEVNYNFEDLLSGVENVEGVQSRTCVDNNGCVVVDKEEKMCLVKAEIYIELERVCNDYYIKVYDMWTGKLLARVRDRRFEDMPSLDVLFNSAEDKICDSCFNGLLDQGEEGVDCGGLCKSCDDWSYSLNLFEKLMWRLGG